jgi:hypothetical protein
MRHYDWGKGLRGSREERKEGRKLLPEMTKKGLKKELKVRWGWVGGGGGGGNANEGLNKELKGNGEKHLEGRRGPRETEEEA